MHKDINYIELLNSVHYIFHMEIHKISATLEINDF